MDKEIIIKISPEGDTSVEAFGFKGRECVEATEGFEWMLGEVKDRQRKREFYVQETTKGKNHVRSG